jgi:hypothetical protein
VTQLCELCTLFRVWDFSLALVLRSALYSFRRFFAAQITMIDVLDFIIERGGNPEKVRESQRRRYAPESVVDEVIELWQDARKSESK